MENLSNFIIPAILIGIAGWIVVLARAYVRGRMRPMCWQCGAWKVNPSTALRRLDLLPMLTLLIPVRCGGCLRRFYSVRGVKPQEHRPAWQTQNRSLRYVDENSTTLALIYALFGPPGQRPKVRLRVTLPLLARPKVYTPEVEAKLLASETGAATIPQTQGQQLSKLLQALVEEGKPAARSAPGPGSGKPRRRRRRARAANGY